MGEDLFSVFNTGSLYIQKVDGTELEVGKIKDMDITIDVASNKDFTSYSLGRSYEGSFKYESINKNIFRQLTDKSYCKYLKRVNNRNKLCYNLKKKGRKL